jgi:hypothetical protein
MAFLTTTIRGIEYGAEFRAGARSPVAYGLFRRRPDGSWGQDRGTGQTPAFRDERQFRTWVLRQLRAAREMEEPRRGRPVTTGSDSTRPVQYRVSAARRAELDAEGARLGISGDLVAKLRAFPTGP